MSVLRKRDLGDGWYVRPAVSLQQPLMRGRQEREPREIVLVIDFDALGKARIRIARHDQADQDAIHIYLIPIRRRPATQSAAIRKARIRGSVKSNDIASGPVCDRDRPAEIDGIDNVGARPLE